ncbi:MAG: hypothetical protein AB7I50_21855, partial [Vicinamibacterales bacterium]
EEASRTGRCCPEHMGGGFHRTAVDFVFTGWPLWRYCPSGASVFILLLSLSSSSARAQLTRVSVASDGTPENGHSFYAALSADGRQVAFCSEATNLVPDDTNGVVDVFVRDRLLATTTRVSVSTNGNQSNAHSCLSSTSATLAPRLTGDGRYVMFVSNATNLLDDVSDTNDAGDVFVHDRLLHRTSRLSEGPGGQQFPRLLFGIPPVPRLFGDDGRTAVLTVAFGRSREHHVSATFAARAGD